jgi:hypothetical protein
MEVLKYGKEVYAAMEGIDLNDDEQTMFDSWSKEAIYEAYVLETEKNKRLEVVLKRQEQRLAMLRHLTKQMGEIL